MNHDIAAIIYNDTKQILNFLYKYLSKSEVFEKCEFYLDYLKPLFSSSLERHLYSALDTFVYDELSDQFPLLKNLIDICVKFICPNNQLCVKNASSGVADEIVNYVFECMVKDGLIPCFVNSVAINNRLNRIQQNFTQMGVKTNWLTKIGIWNFIREKDYWIDSDYTSNVTTSSLQVAVDDKRQSLADINVNRGDSAYTREAVKRPASHDHSTDSEASNPKCLRDAFPKLSEDLRVLRENPCRERGGGSKKSCRLKNLGTSSTCLSCKHKIKKHPKIKRNKTAIKSKQSINPKSRNRCKNDDRVEFLHRSKMMKESSSSTELFKGAERANKMDVRFNCPEVPQALQVACVEKKEVEFAEPVLYLNVIVKERADTDEETEHSGSRILTLDDRVSNENESLRDSNKSDEKVCKRDYESNNDSCPLQLEVNSLRVIEKDTRSSDKLTTEVVSHANEVAETASVTTALECSPELGTDSIFTILDKLQLSPYGDVDAHPELRSSIQQLLGPILSERNQVTCEADTKISVQTVGMQTQLEDVERKETNVNGTDASKISSDLEKINNFIKTCKSVEQNIQIIKNDTFYGDGDCAYPKLANKKAPRKICYCNHVFESDVISFSSTSKVFEYEKARQSSYFKNARRPYRGKRGVAYATKTKYAKPRAKGNASDGWYRKNVKKSVVADFLCLPFTQVIRELVHKILTERDREKYGDDNYKSKYNCNDRYKSSSPDLRKFDSSYDECRCSPTASINRKAVSASGKKMEKRNPNYRLAGGNDIPSCKRFRLRNSAFHHPMYKHRAKHRKLGHCKSEVYGNFDNNDCLSCARSCCSDSTKGTFTISTHSIDTPATCDRSSAYRQTSVSDKCCSIKSFRCFSTRCRNEEKTRCVKYDMLCSGMTGMRDAHWYRTIGAFPNENRSGRYHSHQKMRRQHKKHDPRFCTDLSDKLNKQVETERTARSSSICRSPCLSESCCHKKKQHLSKLEFKRQQHVESAINFDPHFRNKFSQVNSHKTCSMRHIAPYNII